MGDKGRQDPWEAGHTVQQRETRRGTIGKQRDARPSKKADAPSNKGTQEGVQWETRGDKTLGKPDTPFNTKADTLRKH